MQEVGVGGVGGLTPLVPRDRNLVCLSVLDQRLPRVDIPLAPGRDHPDAGVVRVIPKLEAHLVVALAGGAVGHRVGACLAGDLDLPSGDERPRDRGAEKVDALVNRVGPEHGEHVVAHEGLAQILDADVAHAERLRLGARGLQLLSLADVGSKGDHLAAVGLLQPAQDDRGVEPAGVCEHHLLRRLTHRLVSSPAGG